MAEIRLIDESDRGAVIVGAALLDARLEQALKEAFAPQKLSKKQLDKLFENNGPLSTFSGKSVICRAFNLITEDTYHDLEIIMGLRNDFAHGTDEVDFLDQSVSDSVRALRVFKRATSGFEGRTYNLKPEHKGLPPWEIRAKGFVKFSKSAFCLAVQILDLEMTEHSIRRLGHTGPLPSEEVQKPLTARLYSIAALADAERIELEGFSESEALDTDNQPHRGIWLTRRPIIPKGQTHATVVCFAVEMPYSSFEKFGMLEAGRPPTELRWLVPAETVNAQSRKRLSAGELELIGHPEHEDEPSTAN